MSTMQTIKSGPIGSAVTSVHRLKQQVRWPGSANHWESRYHSGGNSGAGSCGEVAAYKAAFLNEFVASRGVQTVVEFGCGVGAQLGLATHPRYIGLYVAKGAVEMRERRRGGTSRGIPRGWARGS